MQHDLKTWPVYFNRIKDRTKTFEVRKNDQDFQTGDTLLLLEWDPIVEQYTGREMAVTVEYILHGGRFGVQEGYVVMAIK